MIIIEFIIVALLSILCSILVVLSFNGKVYKLKYGGMYFNLNVKLNENGLPESILILPKEFDTLHEKVQGMYMEDFFYRYRRRLKVIRYNGERY